MEETVISCPIPVNAKKSWPYQQYYIGETDQEQRRNGHGQNHWSGAESPKLQSLEHRRKVASLSVFYRLHFGECASELHDLIPPSPFYHRTSRDTAKRHRYMVEVPWTRTKRFASTYFVRTARLWNSLPESLFPEKYNLGVFKSRVNRFLLVTSKIDSENRYIVRVPNGEALYIASETSSSTQRCFCGSGRAFVMRLHDNTRQEAMVMHRRLAGSSCFFPCRLQEMTVITPPGDYVGRVQQQCTWMVPVYHVRDATDQVLFVIEGPAVLQRSALMLSEFKIMTSDSLREVGKISHGWDRDLVSFATTLLIPSNAVQPKHKSLLLAATFLLEYTYFERTKVKCCRCGCFR